MALRFFPNEVNFIKTLITHPCARPWYVWVETFIPSFLVLLLTVVLFDVEDAIRDHGKKISGKGAGRKGRRHSPKVSVSGAKHTINRWSQKGLRTLLIVTGPLETLGFLWLIYSAVDQFFLNWQTLLESRVFCARPLATGPLQLSRGPGLISLVVGGVPVILDTTEQNRATWSHTSIKATLPPGEFHAFFVLKVTAPASGVTGVFVRLRFSGVIFDTLIDGDPLDLGPGETGDITVSAHFTFPLVGGGALVWEIAGATIPIGIESVSGWMGVHRTN